MHSTLPELGFSLSLSGQNKMLPKGAPNPSHLKKKKTNVDLAIYVKEYPTTSYSFVYCSPLSILEHTIISGWEVVRVNFLPQESNLENLHKYFLNRWHLMTHTNV